MPFTPGAGADPFPDCARAPEATYYPTSPCETDPE